MPSIRESKRAGGKVYGVDIVMTLDILFDSNMEVATIPPMEWPMSITCVFAGYSDRMYVTAVVVYAICDARVEP